MNVKSAISKHKLLVILVAVILLATVAAIVGVTQFKKARQIDELVAEGDRYLSELDYENAIACYNQALIIDDRNKDANLALAECYSQSGKSDIAVEVYNSMIENNPKDGEAYSALASLYMSLGKPELARELMAEAHERAKFDSIEEMYTLTHPTAPELDRASGVFNERVLLQLSSPDLLSGIYYTLDGSEPTAESKRYDYPIALPNGKTVVKAIAINSSGFESEVAIGEFTVNIADKDIEFADKRLESLVRAPLGISGNEPIKNDDLESIISLYILGDHYVAVNSDPSVIFDRSNYRINGYGYSAVSSGSVSELSDIAQLPFLETLVIAYQRELDISALSGAKQLKRLSLIGNNLTSEDLPALSELTELEELCLGWNFITDISALSKLSGLKSIALWGNKISDVSPLSGLTSLEYLDFSDNVVRDISALTSLSSLRELWMYNNGIASVAPLTELEALEVLMLRGNGVADLESLRPIYPHLVRIDADPFAKEVE